MLDSHGAYRLKQQSRVPYRLQRGRDPERQTIPGMERSDCNDGTSKGHRRARSEGSRRISRIGAGLLALIAAAGIANPAEARETHTLRTDGAYARFYYKMDGQRYKITAYLNDTDHGDGRNAQLQVQMWYHMDVPWDFGENVGLRND